jgi:RHH-type proline utilization regulon transcriptional repressor/proline dehydrogenase/delta 1-pyrroline-5-carboxylate dehydrogenase
MAIVDETAILRHGRALFAGVRARRPAPLSRAWLDDQAMAWTMRDERLKVQLFRFIDALPGLNTRDDIVRHLGEYLLPVAEALPAAARPFLRRLRPGSLLAPVAALLARSGAHRLARRFIAGDGIQGIVATAGRLRRQGLAFTADMLGEAIVSEDEADRYQTACLRLIDGLADAAAGWAPLSRIDRDHRGAIPAANVSLKLSALISRFDPTDPVGCGRVVRRRLLPILHRARQRDVFINVDMEQYAVKDLTLRLLTDALAEPGLRTWSGVGVAIQAYLLSSGDDLARLHRWAEHRGAPLWIRLVKGAYHDYEQVVAAQQGWPVPVFMDKAATDANYERLTRFLLERHEVLRPALASHNVRSIAHALAVAEALRLPAGAIEFQMLYGMADALQAALLDHGERLRIYTPVGQLLPGMAYLVRRLLENTSNQSFVRAGFLEHRDEEGLLMKPHARKDAVAEPVSASRGGFVNEPLLDFGRDTVRRDAAQALAALHERLAAGPLPCPLIIAGRESPTERAILSRNPSRLAQVVGRSACAGISEARQAVAAARSAFPSWRDTPAEQRAALLVRVADRLLEQRPQLTALIVLEAGKSLPEADADVAEAIDFCRYYANEMLRLASPRRRDLPGETNRQSYEGRGVAVVIAPWNFPLAILCGMTAAAVVAGDPVVMKPAEQTPAVACALMRAFAAAGAPPGVVNFLPGVGEEIGPALVADPAVSLIAFTGSVAVGLAINRQAAAAGGDEVKRVICEMGGKNAIIIDADADLDEAVLGVVASAFGYQGQKCSACSRVIVLDAVHDRFVERLVAATRSLAIGPAEDASAALGPVIDEEARERILARIEEAKQGARLAYAGVLPPGHAAGCFVAPHIFSEVAPASRLAQEEIFGPVLAVLRAPDLDQALAIANGTRYALTGGFYSRSPSSIARVGREFRVGNLYLNRRITGALVDRQPFGGFRLSGIGSKAGGPDYLLQFLVPRCVTENTMRHGFTPSEDGPGI